jgi:hypothetical protein
MRLVGANEGGAGEEHLLWERRTGENQNDGRMIYGRSGKRTESNVEMEGSCVDGDILAGWLAGLMEEGREGRNLGRIEELALCAYTHPS